MTEDVPKGIDAERVGPWLGEHVSGATGPFRYELLAGGHSNLTYLVTGGDGARFVLRRPPTGHLLASAHDMAREHRIIAAVGPTAVPVPPALALCEDDTVNDAPFYIMGYVEGHVLHDRATTEDVVPADRRPQLAESLIDVLAELHLVDPDAVGLGDLGKKADYIPRQLRRWSRQWEQSKTRELPVMERIHSELERRIPEQVGASIVHGDYRFGNCLSADGRIAAVLDWELCTLGDPMADVGYLMNNWMQPGEAVLGREEAPTAAGGFPDRDVVLGRYANATGRDVSMVDYYRAFSYWRLAAIVEGVLARYLGGQMGEHDDPSVFRVQVDSLAEAAAEAIDRLG
ncbi:MAG: phosphotransferase family protein [Actinomycetota bacterium]